MTSVVFDAYWWGNGPAAVRHVMREIILEWRRQAPEDVMILICRPDDPTNIRETLGRDGIVTISTRLWPHGASAPFLAAGARRRFNADAVLMHNFAAPSRRSVVLLHDLLFLDHPEWFSRRERIYFSLMLPLAKRSNLVIATSTAEATRIRRYLSAPPVEPVGIGMSEELLYASAERPSIEVTSRSFLLTVGRLNVRKNLGSAMLGALESGLLTRSFPLVVVGEEDGAREGLPAAARAAIDSGKILLLGHVSDAQLKWLYSNASTTLMVSLGEGFGMPPLESLAFGTPVVVSDLPVFRENLADQAIYVDPYDIRSISEGIAAALALRRDDKHDAAREGQGRSQRWPGVVQHIRSSIEHTVDSA